MAVVIASALDKDMAGNPLFRGVSFKLERGDRMTLAGRNGAGKTTLLRMLAGETGIDGGELAFEKGTRVALHDQRPPRERDLTLRDYVLSGCRDLVALEEDLRRLEGQMAERPDDGALLQRYSRAQSRLEHAGGWNWRAQELGPVHGLGFSDDQLDRELSSFSGGELTRASLARALAGDPEVMLLDEPFSALDPLIRRDMQNEVIRLHHDLKKTMVFITHDLAEALKLGDHVMILRGGAVVQIGRPEELVARPADAYVEDFVRDIPKSHVLTLRWVMRPATPDDPTDGPLFPSTAVIRTVIHAAAASEKPIRVVDNGELVGVVDRASILESVAGEPEVPAGVSAGASESVPRQKPPVGFEPVRDPFQPTAEFLVENQAERSADEGRQ
jgi:ABC-type proline/glycine betaine transport system ATPase subunit